MNRRDGIKLKKKDGMHALMPFIMPKRADSDVYINAKVDVTELVKYMDKLKKKDEYKHITYFHLFAIACGKLIYNRPLMNRFVINKEYYDRKDVSLSFVAKKEFKDGSEETLSVVKVEKDDNLFTLSDKISGKVKNTRASKNNNTDDFVDKIGKLPKFMRWLLIKILIFMDNHDLIPSSLTENLIYYSSVILSNLGSIDCDGAIYHHLTDFGTNSVLMTMGKILDEPKVINGKVETRKVIEFGITIDERIADGYYFVKSLELLEYILNNPKLLEDRADAKVEIKK
jgi:pyruvate/2-oxoglutarate dehydrogenase complex dihydrolipoamide acyltransferase (E2) component